MELCKIWVNRFVSDAFVDGVMACIGGFNLVFWMVKIGKMFDDVKLGVEGD